MPLKHRIKNSIKKSRKLLKSANRYIVAFPAWIVLGLSHIPIDNQEKDGWTKSREQQSTKKMY